MDNLTRIVKTEISRQYKSVRQFAFAVNIPLSTINSALHNGIGGSSFDTVVQICQTLGIKAISSDASFYLTEDTQQLLDQYAQLDDYGRHTIASVMKLEYDRCSTQGAEAQAAAIMSSAPVSTSPPTWAAPRWSRSRYSATIAVCNLPNRAVTRSAGDLRLRLVLCRQPRALPHLGEGPWFFIGSYGA